MHHRLSTIPLSTLNYPPALPIVEKRQEIVAAIRRERVVIVAGDTGSGKTTQLPKMCLEAGLGVRGRIGCTQPRRIAALSVSRRIAEELGVQWGGPVGCTIRFSDKSSPDTVVKVMTDGILLAETRRDPLLRAYEAIIIDEAHERSLNIDFLLGHLKNVLERRSDLKVIITSATIDTARFAEAFGNAPVFEVSGRLYPVDVRYEPLVVEKSDDTDDEDEELTYVVGAVRAAEAVISDSRDGDVLVFMPTERDILETREILAGRLSAGVDVLPLMGSLSAVEQEQVFKASGRRKVIVATNIAETSLTIPNIRYVIDTGLARVSRYNARTRTKRLPIEKISKSSAKQRAGRAGRVREGVCIRLYSEDEFEARPNFTDPEIVRSNLAEVILRMKAGRLGDVESFPFLDRPDDRAVRSGYQLLHELGAIDEENVLTHIGRELAGLPVDPTIGRMIIQARREHASRDVMIIAAGLSLQDPRERPLEKRQKADEIHRTFRHPDSDFLTLLNLWNAFQGEFASGKTQNQVRKFCKANFLSYLRMREWTDIFKELCGMSRLAVQTEGGDGLKGSDTGSIKRFDGTYRAIHRSILSGLLGQVAYRTDRNTYRASANRSVFIGPGSSLQERRNLSKNELRRKKAPSKDPGRQPWIVAGEIIETERLYARTVAPVAPGWIEELSKHLARRTIEDPRYDGASGRVTARERITLNGLTIAHRRSDYARVNPAHAKELFIVHAILSDESPLEYPFVTANRKLCDKLGSALARVGRFNRDLLEESLLTFYTRQLPAISTTRELERFVKEVLPKEDRTLIATASDLLEYMGVVDLPMNFELFPDTVSIGGTSIDLHYRYEPHGGRDGVTLSIPAGLVQQVPAYMVEGIVPGLREQQVLHLLRYLPKEYRTRLGKVDEVGRVIARDERFRERPLISGLAQYLRDEMGIDVPLELLDFHSLPEHLRPRVEIVEGGRVITAGRSLEQLQSEMPREESGDELAVVSEARQRWEREVQQWDFADLPDGIEITRIAGVALIMYPALVYDEQRVHVRLFEDREHARLESALGLNNLVRKHLLREIQEMERQAREVEKFKPLLTLYTSPERLRADVVEAALRFMLRRESQYPPNRCDFDATVSEAKAKMPNLVGRILSWVSQCLQLRRVIIDTKRPYPGMRQDLESLLPHDFLRTTPFEQLEHLPRYLKAMTVRAERYDNDPGRDAAKAKQVEPFIQRLRSGVEHVPDFRWIVEELKVSIFAQQLGTAYPVSVERIGKLLAG